MKSLLEDAKALSQYFVVIPTKGKIPIIEYADRRNQVATDKELVEWFSNGKANGAAIAINQTEFAIETDGKGEEIFQKKILPRLPVTLQRYIKQTMTTKTPHGIHRTFRISSPDGVKESVIVKYDGGHDEVRIQGVKQLLVERGSGYEIINDVSSIITIQDIDLTDLIERLDNIKLEFNGIKTVLGVLLPYYKQPNRQNIAFGLSGFLHKNGVPKYLILDCIERLATETNDSEINKRLRIVKDTCNKKADSDEVSGYQKLLEALDNNKVAINEIEQVFAGLCPPTSEFSKKKSMYGESSSAVDRDKKSKDKEREGHDPIVKTITEDILMIYRFVTTEENKEILFYDNGVYRQGGEVVIEKIAESLYGYKVANRYLTEIKGHIMRKTYRKREELDSDINIINLKNGLFNIQTGNFKEHDPNYLSITQMPIVYTPRARPKLFGKYLKQVLYPTEIRTGIELMAYTLYRGNPFEIIAKLFGYGANGKSVFTGLLTAIHGSKNVSNVPLSSMLNNRFALSDLENRHVNIDAELSSTTIHDTTILKKLTGRQPVRIERKNQRAYDATLFAKLFFSANKIPETEDDSDAYFRRETIISFPNRFEGENQDPNLLKKLSTEEELSGIFNVLANSLKTVLRNEGIFVNEKTIEQRKLRHQLAVNPIQYFLEDAIDKGSVESDTTFKDDLYDAYKLFCNKYKLGVERKDNLGRILKGNKYRFQDDREGEREGKRKRYWKGIKLAVPDSRPTTDVG